MSNGGGQSGFVFVVGSNGGVFSSNGSLVFSFNFFSEVGQQSFDLF